MLDPAFEEGSDCHAGGIDARAGLYLGKQSGALDLGLSLGARKGMPAAFALAGLRIAHVNHDGPMTRRPFAQMASHFCFSLSVHIGRSNTRALCSGVNKSSSPSGAVGGSRLTTSETTPITFSMPSLIAS